MKNPAIIVVIAAVIVVLIPAILIFLSRRESGVLELKTEREIVTGEIFQMNIGESVILDNLHLLYLDMIYPPKSYEGDPNEFTFPKFVVTQNDDRLGFGLSDKRTELRYHDYLIKFIKREEEVVTLQIEKSSLSVKVKEEEAVKKAIKAAEENNIQNPEARVRTLKENVWEIEIGGGPDIYFIVKINAENGDILEAYRQTKS